MNGKTAKLIRRYARVSGQYDQRRALKKAWTDGNMTPKQKHKLRNVLTIATNNMHKEQLARAAEAAETAKRIASVTKDTPVIEATAESAPSDA